MNKKCSLNNYFKSEAYGLSMYEQCALSRAHWQHPYPHNNNSWWHSVWVYGVLLHTAWQSHVACVPIQTHTRTHSHTRARRIVMTFIVSSKGQLGCRSKHITAVCVIRLNSFAWHCIVVDTLLSRASVTPVTAYTLHEAVTIARSVFNPNHRWLAFDRVRETSNEGKTQIKRDNQWNGYYHQLYLCFGFVRGPPHWVIQIYWVSSSRGSKRRSDFKRIAYY